MVWTVPILKTFLLCVVKIETLLSIQRYVVTQAVHLSGPYTKIRTAQGANQNAPFQCGPVQLYNKDEYNISNSPYVCMS